MKNISEKRKEQKENNINKSDYKKKQSENKKSQLTYLKNSKYNKRKLFRHNYPNLLKNNLTDPI